jgi:hypothetical protein
MATGQDADVEDEGESHRRQVVGVASNPPTGHRLPVLVETARNQLLLGQNRTPWPVPRPQLSILNGRAPNSAAI